MKEVKNTNLINKVLKVKSVIKRGIKYTFVLLLVYKARKNEYATYLYEPSNKSIHFGHYFNYKGAAEADLDHRVFCKKYGE